jgi:hypothetical protein
MSGIVAGVGKEELDKRSISDELLAKKCILSVVSPWDFGFFVV